MTSKRLFDVTLALIGLILFWWLILLCWLVASVETRSNGLFFQNRVGLHGRLFKIIKIKTMFDAKTGKRSPITALNISKVTRSGRLMRKFKLDELPQLWNVLTGKMSFVGPRPDVQGFADKLVGEQRLILELRPGITGPASLAYRDEESILEKQTDPKAYNANVMWPNKVAINLRYYHNRSLRVDLMYIFKTILSR